MPEQNMSRSERRKQLERQKRQKMRQRVKKKKPTWRKIVRIIGLLALIAFLSGVSLFGYYVATAPELDEKLLKDPLTSKIVDAEGELVMNVGAEKREFVPYDEIPEQIKDAILATEDVRFFEHHGIDFYRLGGAVIANFRDGFGSQGASTLTQQVIKNSFSWQDKTLKRKAQEAWLAIKLEQKYSKEQIFEMYFNKILMSGMNYGFGTGAKYFYDKSLDELELHEAAMLAGLPQSPNGYNPFQNPERAEKRRNIVLLLMEKHGKITPAERAAAEAVPVTTTLAQNKQESLSKYPAYIDLVLSELESAGLQEILAEGVTIQTALQQNVQQSVEEKISNDALYESEKMQSAMTVLDTKTGAIVAIGGGRHYSGRDLNLATRTNRSPGSVIKPILSYGPAIEHFDWSTGQAVDDKPYKYKGTNKSINNVDGRFLGTITLRDALYKSRNIPAVKVFEEVGPTKASQFARNLGLPYKDVHAAHALGGGEYSLSTVEVAGAYAAFGNGGMFTRPHAVKKIIFRNGEERNMTPQQTNAMKNSTAYMITDVLRDVLTKGTGKRANVANIDVAGKTGTTNYDAKDRKKHNMKDRYVPDTWFAGYSGQYTIAAWGGYESYYEPIKTYDKGRYVPQNLFRQVMQEIATERGTMSKPSSVTEATIVYGSNPVRLASASTPENMRVTELFVKGSMPKGPKIEEKEEEKEELLPSPSNFSASYNADENTIHLSWAYDQEAEFTVQYSTNEGTSGTVATTTGHEATLSGASLGQTYTFTVIAKVDGSTSAPASTSIQLQSKDVEEPEEELPEEELPEQPEEKPEPTPPEQGNNGNGTNPDGGNQDNNGEGHDNKPKPEPTPPEQGNKPKPEPTPPPENKPKPEPTPPPTTPKPDSGGESSVTTPSGSIEDVTSP